MRYTMKNMIRSAVFANLLLAGVLSAQSAVPAATEDKAKPAEAPVPATAGKHSVVPYRYHTVSQKAVQYYAVTWGVDSLSVKSAESGEIIRFTYRVLDATKAKALNDKKYEPSLIDPKAGVELVVPSLEKVGKLRQSSAPEAGKVYWMAFSNKGRIVKPGSRVNVVIGPFRADGLIVQ